MVKKIQILLLSLLFSSYSIAQEKEYNLVFSDDFDGTSLDISKWNVQGGYAANQEKQYYTDRTTNIRVEDGNLVLTALKENFVADRNYTSGRIHSKGKGFIKYGKAEARIHLPVGKGTWPAFWMMPEENVYGVWPYSGEIDIMEHVGADPRMTSHAVHTANKNGSKGNNWQSKHYMDGMENQFHTYSIEWESDRIIFFIDGLKSATVWRNTTEDYKGWPFDQNFYAILNLAMGGTMGGTIDDNIFSSPVEMKVDYVKLYQLKDPSSIAENQSQNSITVSPSVFSDHLQIETLHPCSIILTNINGNIVINKHITGNESIITQNLPKGIYILKANNQSFKLIK